MKGKETTSTPTLPDTLEGFLQMLYDSGYLSKQYYQLLVDRYLKGENKLN